MLHGLIPIMVGQLVSAVNGLRRDSSVVLVSEQVFPSVGAIRDNLQLDDLMKAGSDVGVMNA